MKILQWNLENFFIDLQDPHINVSKIDESTWSNHGSSTVHKNKALFKLEEIAKIIKENDPDVCVFQEIAGKHSIENFNRLFLENQYEVHMTPSNSRRGIDIGFLVRPNTFETKLHTNKNMNLSSKVKEKAKFCRDIPELHLTKDGKTFIILGVHLKSKHSSDEDYFGVETRAAEVQGILKIYNRLKEKGSVLIAGDFNGFLQKDNCEYEFESLLAEGFFDYHEKLEGKDRTSFVRLDPYSLNQIDYILIHKDLENHVDIQSGFIRYKGFYDIEIPHPQSFKEKGQLPSDHYPQMIVLKNIFK